MSAPGQIVARASLRVESTGLAWSPDGRWIAASGWNTGVEIVDADSGTVVWFGSYERAAGVAVDSTGRRLAVAIARRVPFFGESTPGSVRVLDLATKAEVWKRDDLDGVLVAFSPDGRHVAITNRTTPSWSDPIGTLRLVDGQTGANRFDLGIAVVGAIFALEAPVAFSPDSRLMAAASETGVFAVDTHTGERWDVPTPARVSDIAFDHDGTHVLAVCPPTSVLALDAATGAVQTNATLEGPFPTAGADDAWEFAFSPDKRLLLKVGRYGFGVYTVAHGRTRFEPRSFPGYSPSAHFSPDGRHAALDTLIDGKFGLRFVDVSSGATVWERTPVVPQMPEYQPFGLAFRSDGRRLVIFGPTSDGAGFVSVHDTGMERSRRLHDGAVTAVAAASGGIRLVATASADRKAAVMHADSGELLFDREHPGVLTSIVFSPDGQLFATASTDGGARLFQTVSGSRLWLLAHGGPVAMIAFTADGTGVVSVSADKTARLIARDGGEERWRRAHPQAVSSVAVSRDGRWVATGSGDRSTRILDAATGQEVFRIARDGKIRGLAFGPAVLASANDDGTVLLIDPVTGREVGQVVHPRAVTAVAISRDGSLLASSVSDSTVRLTDLAGGAPVLLAQLSYSAPVVKLAFNPVARRLAVVTEDFVVRIVDPAADGIELARYVHPASVRDIAFTPDGELIATACDDGYSRVFSGA